VDVEDGARINLTNSPDVYDRNPSWSPDGKRIAFCSGNFTGAQIYIMDADGSNVVKLTDKELGCHPVFVHNDIRLFFSASGPSWSPDGKRIVFYGSTVCRPDPSLGVGGWDSIFIVDIDSRQVLDLIATGPGDYYRPVWSPR
jgi:Tol biopolymer transport system component